MPNMVEISRVVVIADTVIERVLLEAFLKLGAKGYSCMPCTGKGRHETLQDPFSFSGQSRVRIEVLTKPDVADAIIDFVHKKQFGVYPVAAYTDTVRVHERDTFY